MNTCFSKYHNIHIPKGTIPKGTIPKGTIPKGTIPKGNNKSRVFLIGNGPSLNKTDLDLIKDEYSIAMNRISLIFDKTEWRPTYYIFCSSNCDNPNWGKEWTSSIHKIIENDNIKPFIYSKYQKTILKDLIKNKYINEKKIKNVEWFHSVSEKKPDNLGNIDPICFSSDIVKRIDKTGTTMNVALQLANYMGFEEIILLGCDLGFKPDNGLNDTDPNHFSKEYNADIPEYKIDKINNQMRNVHKLARMKIDKKIKMYNATIIDKTQLDIYPRIDYKELIINNNYKFIE